MPALIVFASTAGGGGGESSNRPDHLRVQEDADDVVRKLGATDSGFVDLTPGNKPDQKVWINRAQVRMVRSG